MFSKKNLKCTSSAMLFASIPALALQAQGGVDGGVGLGSKELAGKSLSNNAVTTVVKVVGFVVVVVALGCLLYYIANRMSSSKSSLSEKVEQKGNANEVESNVRKGDTFLSKPVLVNKLKINTGNQKKDRLDFEPDIKDEKIFIEEDNIYKNKRKSTKKEIKNKDQIIENLESLDVDSIDSENKVFDRKNFSDLEEDFKDDLNKMEQAEKGAKNCRINIDSYEKMEEESFKDLEKVIKDFRKVIVSRKFWVTNNALKKLRSKKLDSSKKSDEEIGLEEEFKKYGGEIKEKFEGGYVPAKYLDVAVQNCLKDIEELRKGKNEKYGELRRLFADEKESDSSFISRYLLLNLEKDDWGIWNSLEQYVDDLEGFVKKKTEENIENSDDIKRNKRKLFDLRVKFNIARNKIVEDLENDGRLPYLDLGEDIGGDLLSNKVYY